MEHPEFENLYLRYREGKATKEEVKILMEFLRKPEMEVTIKETLAKEIEALENKPVPYNIDISDQRMQDMLKQIMSEPNQSPVIELSRTSGIKIWRYVAAAVIILAFVGSYFAFIIDKKQPDFNQGQLVNNDVAPGHDGAILTLADGRTIVLDNAQDGRITDVAVKTGNQISYENSGLTKVEFNTMTTPKGRQFSLILPDGSQVWLNAASSITYPTAFIGGDRKVSITGEAYFEVAKSVTVSGEKQSFIVTVNGMNVQVLGTQFNINSYGDDGNIKTTLLEGSIKVAVEGKTQMVKPGQQVQVANNNIKLVSDADIDAVMAWKNGFFSFEAASIKDIMKQLSRWYDVEVIYQAEPKELFVGKIDRSLTLSQVLKALARNEVNFKIEGGKRIIILP